MIYSRQSKEQERCIHSGEFSHSLYTGLAKMTRLRKVAFIYKWKDHPAELIRIWSRSPLQLAYPAGSLARSWNPYHLKPSLPAVVHLVRAFKRILHALSKTGQSVNFAHSLKLPGDIFNSTSDIFRYGHIWDYAGPTTQSIRELTISILPSEEASGESIDKLDLFESLLLNASTLKCLRLFVDKSVYSRQRISLSQVFPTKRYPKNLVRLHLVGIRSSSEELSVFFQHMPKLRHLTLEEIDIEEGCWKDVTESVIKWTALCSIRMRALRELETGVTVSMASLYEPLY